MNLLPSSLLYLLVSVAGVWVILLWLWSRPSRTSRPGVPVKVIAGATTVLLLFLPLGGVPLWNRVFSFYPNPSLPMLGIVCAALWSRLFALTVFQRGDWSAIWIFGAVAGCMLYLHPMFVGAIDLYYWGWDRVISAIVVGTLAVGLLAGGSRLGVLLLAALIAYGVTALESRNCWDYVMDPFYWLISLGVLTVRAVAAGLRQAERLASRGRATPAPAAVGATAVPVPALESAARGFDSRGEG